MKSSDSIAGLAAALAKAQGEIQNAAKNAKNPHFKSNYADLAEILNTVRPVLSRHGLSVIQVPGFDDGAVTVETILAHESGEWVAGVAAAVPGKVDPQGIGSAVTYLRRYALAAFAGIAQEDDDGQGAIGPREEMMTDGQKKLLLDLVKSHVFTDDDRERARKQCETLTRAEAIPVIDGTQKALARRKAAEEAAAREPGEDDEELPLDDKRPRKRIAQEEGA
jgi:hypothetical protein